MMNRVPVPPLEFVQKKNFDDVYKLMFDQRNTYDYKTRPAVVILTGKSGVGKTETALQLFNEVYARDSDGTLPGCVEGCFSSYSASSLVSDIKSFAKDYQLSLLSLSDSQSRDLDNLAVVMEELYCALDSKYPTQMKCLTFDDAEITTAIVQHIDEHICMNVIEGNDSIKQRQWKVVVTTQYEDKDHWLDKCRFLGKDNFHAVEPFTLEETRNYFSRISSIHNDQKDRLYESFNGLPLALKVTKGYLLTNKLTSGRAYLDRLFREIAAIEAPDSISVLHYTMRRLIDSTTHPDLSSNLIKMISLLNEKNITIEILKSLTEVASSPVYSNVSLNINVESLSNELLAGLERRHLCEIPDGRGSFSFHKLVQNSTELFSGNDSDQKKISVLRTCLIALTRVAPKDGRGHQSHKICSYMYRHSESVCKQVDKLKESGVVNRKDTPSILLLYSDLLSSMAYCQLALRNPIDDANPLLIRALDSISETVLDCKYDQIGKAANLSTDKERAELLLDALKDESHMCYSSDYQKLVEEISQYRRLTKKDLSIMIDFEEVLRVEDHLENGHLNDLYYQLLSERGMILSKSLMSKIYMIEHLVGLYYVSVRAPNFVSGDEEKSNLFQSAWSCGQAALKLCTYIREAHQISFMAEVIIERQILALELKLENRPVSDIITRYQVLSQIGEDVTRRYGYECGIRRTDFLNDEYHQLVCMEGMAICYGILYKQCDGDKAKAEAHYKDGTALFQELLEKSKRFNNHQTTSQTYKKYAAFQWMCNKMDDAIKSLIDAMIYVTSFLGGSSPNDKFPEPQNDGRFKLLYSELGMYVENWSAINIDRDRDTMLQVTVAADVPRIKYLMEFTDHMRSTNPPEMGDEFPVLRDLIPDQQDLSVLEPKESGVDVQPSTSKTVNTVETLTFKTVENVQPSTSAKGQDEVKISHPVQATD